MIAFPNCKINIGLQVTGKRPDGFHDIETIFYPINIKEAIEIIPSVNETSFSHSGQAIPGSAEDNLCMKAWRLLEKEYRLPPVNIHLHKAIPMGAGLGGGSADAAFLLKLINNIFQLDIPEKALIGYALQLGSDCPFFIINKPCFASGRGEILEEVTIDLSNFKIFVVNPGIHVNTGWAFAQITPQKRNNPLRHISSVPVADWLYHFTNDFEKPVFAIHPEISMIKETLLGHQAVYSAMSGSGSTVYGIFEKDVSPVFNFPAHYFCKWV